MSAESVGIWGEGGSKPIECDEDEAFDKSNKRINEIEREVLGSKNLLASSRSMIRSVLKDVFIRKFAIMKQERAITVTKEHPHGQPDSADGDSEVVEGKKVKREEPPWELPLIEALDYIKSYTHNSTGQDMDCDEPELPKGKLDKEEEEKEDGKGREEKKKKTTKQTSHVSIQKKFRIVCDASVTDCVNTPMLIQCFLGHNEWKDAQELLRNVDILYILSDILPILISVLEDTPTIYTVEKKYIRSFRNSYKKSYTNTGGVFLLSVSDEIKLKSEYTKLLERHSENKKSILKKFERIGGSDLDSDSMFAGEHMDFSSKTGLLNLCKRLMSSTLRNSLSKLRNVYNAMPFYISRYASIMFSHGTIEQYARELEDTARKIRKQSGVHFSRVMNEYRTESDRASSKEKKEGGIEDEKVTAQELTRKHMHVLKNIENILVSYQPSRLGDGHLALSEREVNKKIHAILLEFKCKSYQSLSKTVGLKKGAVCYKAESLPSFENFCFRLADSLFESGYKEEANELRDLTELVLRQRRSKLSIVESDPNRLFSSVEQALSSLILQKLTPGQREEINTLLCSAKCCRTSQQMLSFAFRVQGRLYEMLFARKNKFTYRQEEYKPTLQTMVYLFYRPCYNRFIEITKRRPGIRDYKPDFFTLPSNYVARCEGIRKRRERIPLTMTNIKNQAISEKNGKDGVKGAECPEGEDIVQKGRVTVKTDSYFNPTRDVVVPVMPQLIIDTHTTVYRTIKANTTKHGSIAKQVDAPEGEDGGSRTQASKQSMIVGLFVDPKVLDLLTKGIKENQEIGGFKPDYREHLKAEDAIDVDEISNIQMSTRVEVESNKGKIVLSKTLTTNFLYQFYGRDPLTVYNSLSPELRREEVITYIEFKIVRPSYPDVVDSHSTVVTAINDLTECWPFEDSDKFRFNDDDDMHKFFSELMSLIVTRVESLSSPDMILVEVGMHRDADSKCRKDVSHCNDVVQVLKLCGIQASCLIAAEGKRKEDHTWIESESKTILIQAMQPLYSTLSKLTSEDEMEFAYSQVRSQYFKKNVLSGTRIETGITSENVKANYDKHEKDIITRPTGTVIPPSVQKDMREYFCRGAILGKGQAELVLNKMWDIRHKVVEWVKESDHKWVMVDEACSFQFLLGWLNGDVQLKLQKGCKLAWMSKNVIRDSKDSSSSKRSIASAAAGIKELSKILEVVCDCDVCVKKSKAKPLSISRDLILPLYQTRVPCISNIPADKDEEEYIPHDIFNDPNVHPFDRVTRITLPGNNASDHILKSAVEGACLIYMKCMFVPAYLNSKGKVIVNKSLPEFSTVIDSSEITVTSKGVDVSKKDDELKKKLYDRKKDIYNPDSEAYEMARQTYWDQLKKLCDVAIQNSSTITELDTNSIKELRKLPPITGSKVILDYDRLQRALSFFPETSDPDLLKAKFSESYLNRCSEVASVDDRFLSLTTGHLESYLQEREGGLGLAWKKWFKPDCIFINEISSEFRKRYKDTMYNEIMPCIDGLIKVLLEFQWYQEICMHSKICQVFVLLTTEWAGAGVKRKKIPHTDYFLLTKVPTKKYTNVRCHIVDKDYRPVGTKFMMSRRQAILGQSYCYLMLLVYLQNLQQYRCLDVVKTVTPMELKEVAKRSIRLAKMGASCLSLMKQGMVEEAYQEFSIHTCKEVNVEMNPKSEVFSKVLSGLNVSFHCYLSPALLLNSNNTNKQIQCIRFSVMSALSIMNFGYNLGEKFSTPCRRPEQHVQTLYLQLMSYCCIRNSESVRKEWMANSSYPNCVIPSVSVFGCPVTSGRGLMLDIYLCQILNKEIDDFDQGSIRVMDEFLSKHISFEQDLSRYIKEHIEIKEALQERKEKGQRKMIEKLGEHSSSDLMGRLDSFETGTDEREAIELIVKGREKIACIKALLCVPHLAVNTDKEHMKQPTQPSDKLGTILEEGSDGDESRSSNYSKMSAESETSKGRSFTITQSEMDKTSYSEVQSVIGTVKITSVQRDLSDGTTASGSDRVDTIIKGVYDEDASDSCYTDRLETLSMMTYSPDLEMCENIWKIIITSNKNHTFGDVTFIQAVTDYAKDERFTRQVLDKALRDPRNWTALTSAAGTTSIVSDVVEKIDLVAALNTVLKERVMKLKKLNDKFLRASANAGKITKFKKYDISTEMQDLCGTVDNFTRMGIQKMTDQLNTERAKSASAKQKNIADVIKNGFTNVCLKTSPETFQSVVKSGFSLITRAYRSDANIVAIGQLIKKMADHFDLSYKQGNEREFIKEVIVSNVKKDAVIECWTGICGITLKTDLISSLIGDISSSIRLIYSEFSELLELEDQFFLEYNKEDTDMDVDTLKRLRDQVRKKEDELIENHDSTMGRLAVYLIMCSLSHPLFRYNSNSIVELIATITKKMTIDSDAKEAINVRVGGSTLEDPIPSKKRKTKKPFDKSELKMPEASAGPDVETPTDFTNSYLVAGSLAYIELGCEEGFLETTIQGMFRQIGAYIVGNSKPSESISRLCMMRVGEGKSPNLATSTGQMLDTINLFATSFELTTRTSEIVAALFAIKDANQDQMRRMTGHPFSNKIPRSIRSKVIFEFVKVSDAYKDPIMQSIAFRIVSLELHSTYNTLAPKPQVGGDRDLVVQDNKTRIINSTMEHCSKSILKQTDTDGLTSPSLPNRILTTTMAEVKNALAVHGKIVQEGEMKGKRRIYRAFNVAGDCTKWGPIHCTAAFIGMLMQLLKDHPDWKNFAQCAMLFSLTKKIEIPRPVVEKFLRSFMASTEYKMYLDGKHSNGTASPLEKDGLFRENMIDYAKREWENVPNIIYLVENYLSKGKNYFVSYNHMCQGIHHATSSILTSVFSSVVDHYFHRWIQDFNEQFRSKMYHAGSSDDYARIYVVDGFVDADQFDAVNKRLTESILDFNNFMNGVMRVCQMKNSVKSLLSEIFGEFYSNFMTGHEISPSNLKATIGGIINSTSDSPLSLYIGSHSSCQQSFCYSSPMVTTALVSLIKANMCYVNCEFIARRYGQKIFSSLSTMGRLYVPKVSNLLSEGAVFEDIQSVKESTDLLRLVYHIVSKIAESGARKPKYTPQDEAEQIVDADDEYTTNNSEHQENETNSISCASEGTDLLYGHKATGDNFIPSNFRSGSVGSVAELNFGSSEYTEKITEMVKGAMLDELNPGKRLCDHSVIYYQLESSRRKAMTESPLRFRYRTGNKTEVEVSLDDVVRNMISWFNMSADCPIPIQDLDPDIGFNIESSVVSALIVVLVYEFYQKESYHCFPGFDLKEKDRDHVTLHNPFVSMMPRSVKCQLDKVMEVRSMIEAELKETVEFQKGETISQLSRVLVESGSTTEDLYTEFRRSNRSLKGESILRGLSGCSKESSLPLFSMRMRAHMFVDKIGLTPDCSWKFRSTRGQEESRSISGASKYGTNDRKSRFSDFIERISSIVCVLDAPKKEDEGEANGESEGASSSDTSSSDNTDSSGLDQKPEIIRLHGNNGLKEDVVLLERIADLKPRINIKFFYEPESQFVKDKYRVVLDLDSMNSFSSKIEQVFEVFDSKTRRTLREEESKRPTGTNNVVIKSHKSKLFSESADVNLRNDPALVIAWILDKTTVLEMGPQRLDVVAMEKDISIIRVFYKSLYNMIDAMKGLCERSKGDSKMSERILQNYGPLLTNITRLISRYTVDRVEFYTLFRTTTPYIADCNTFLPTCIIEGVEFLTDHTEIVKNFYEEPYYKVLCDISVVGSMLVNGVKVKSHLSKFLNWALTTDTVKDTDCDDNIKEEMAFEEDDNQLTAIQRIKLSIDSVRVHSVKTGLKLLLKIGSGMTTDSEQGAQLDTVYKKSSGTFLENGYFEFTNEFGCCVVCCTGGRSRAYLSSCDEKLLIGIVTANMPSRESDSYRVLTQFIDSLMSSDEIAPHSEAEQYKVFISSEGRVTMKPLKGSATNTVIVDKNLWLPKFLSHDNDLIMEEYRVNADSISLCSYREVFYGTEMEPTFIKIDECLRSFNSLSLGCGKEFGYRKFPMSISKLNLATYVPLSSMVRVHLFFKHKREFSRRGYVGESTFFQGPVMNNASTGVREELDKMESDFDKYIEELNKEPTLDKMQTNLTSEDLKLLLECVNTTFTQESEIVAVKRVLDSLQLSDVDVSLTGNAGSMFNFKQRDIGKHTNYRRISFTEILELAMNSKSYHRSLHPLAYRKGSMKVSISFLSSFLDFTGACRQSDYERDGWILLATALCVTHSNQLEARAILSLAQIQSLCSNTDGRLGSLSKGGTELTATCSVSGGSVYLQFEYEFRSDGYLKILREHVAKEVSKKLGTEVSQSQVAKGAVKSMINHFKEGKKQTTLKKVNKEHFDELVKHVPGMSTLLLYKGTQFSKGSSRLSDSVEVGTLINYDDLLGEVESGIHDKKYKINCALNFSNYCRVFQSDTLSLIDPLSSVLSHIASANSFKIEELLTLCVCLINFLCSKTGTTSDSITESELSNKYDAMLTRVVADDIKPKENVLEVVKPKQQEDEGEEWVFDSETESDDDSKSSRSRSTSSQHEHDGGMDTDDEIESENEFC